jgi:CDP-diacylglycerol--glycerol-3-phosphate 3-phosphatidyltransferase
MNGSQSETVWNVPNRITLVRLILSVILFALIPLGFYRWALVFFVLAAGTDWLDGWYARKYQQVTQLGRILDPFCDKILICGVFILLAVEMQGKFPWYARIAGWMAVVVVARELLVTVLRSLIEGAGGDFSAKFAGKLKMVFQCLAVGACLVALAHHQQAAGQTGQLVAIPDWLLYLMTASIWLAVLSTLHSGYLYILVARSSLAR